MFSMRKINNHELGRLTVEEYQARSNSGVVVVLDCVRSANNVGSFFRTSDAFGVDKLYLCGITPVPPSRDIHKTALGAELSVMWEHRDSTLDVVRELSQDGYKIVAVEQVEGAVMLDELRVDKDAKYALVFGNEVDGVSQEVVDNVDMSVEIPQVGTKHSLNVSVSGGVVLWKFLFDC